MATIQLHKNQNCSVCTKPLVKPRGEASVKLLNQCGHIIHDDCLAKKLAETVSRIDKKAPCPFKGCDERIKCKIAGDRVTPLPASVTAFKAKCENAPPLQANGNPKFVTRTTFAIVALAIYAFCSTVFSFIVASAVLATAMFFENRLIQAIVLLDNADVVLGSGTQQ
ncbi:MAG: hypothetical protein S4CHLAM37_12510 [Chlamydiia bacterium]|nr:hypothetical protein [Chlamydiia bacterium]